MIIVRARPLAVGGPLGFIPLNSSVQIRPGAREPQPSSDGFFNKKRPLFGVNRRRSKFFYEAARVAMEVATQARIYIK